MDNNSTAFLNDPAIYQCTPDQLIDLYLRIRQASETLCAPLAAEDHVIQTMPDVSPPKWHIAHVSWFFETFVLTPYCEGYRPFHPMYAHLFNSYYETAGTFFPRPARGLLSRPTVEEILKYRAHVDQHMGSLLSEHKHPHRQDIISRTVLGLNHEQQHQELLYTDIKHILAFNPLKPAYLELPYAVQPQAPPLQWHDFDEALVETGFGGGGFSFDNETPRHRSFLPGFKIASRPVTNGEYLAFMEDGGYDQVDLWLSEGWKTKNNAAWRAPLYWENHGGEWMEFGLNGLQSLDLNRPVSHISYYEADAYATWAGCRLPTETEWEHVAADNPIEGHFVDRQVLQPQAGRGDGIIQLYGDVWEWTQSAYSPYPGYRPLAGTLGEYNGKFMCSQWVLRGGSCYTEHDHMRSSYRNFFYPKDRWQCTGLRLAADAG